jgi:hypothetical protein
VENPHLLRQEAAVCWQLAREITDPPSVAMLLERAEQLVSRAAALERFNWWNPLDCFADDVASAPHDQLERSPLCAGTTGTTDVNDRFGGTPDSVRAIAP